MLLAPALVLALAAGQSLPPWMTGESRAEDLAVSLVTFGPGDSVTEWWGHTALAVEDRRVGHGRLYNFGIFGSDDPVAFVRKFAKGRLEFWAGDEGIAGTLEWYRKLNRDVRLQELDLTPEQALAVAKALGTHVLPENRMYLYHHYNDNCSTRPRDILDKAIGGQLLAASNAPGRMSIRAHAARYAQVSLPMSVLLDFLQNDELDGPVTLKQEAYLPDELERQVQALEVSRPDGGTGPLVKRQWVWFRANRPPVSEVPKNWLLQELALGLALGGLSLGLGRWSRAGRRLPRVLLGLLTALWGLVPGVLGAALFIMANFTDHTVTYHDENLLFVNPATLAALPLGVALMFGSTSAPGRLRWLWTALTVGGLLDLVLKVLPAFHQNNWNILALALPVNLSMAALWWLQWRRQRAAQRSAT